MAEYLNKLIIKMQQALNIIKTDIRNILRDYSLLVIIFVPLIITALLRWGYPVLLSVVPAISEYSMLLLAMLCMISSIMPGMAISFVILDEKDNQLLPSLMILPVSLKKITWHRNLIIYMYGVIAAIITLSFSGIAEINSGRIIMLAFLAAAPAPVMAMVPAFFAANKIEGATLAKMLNFLIIFPLPAFIFTGWWTNLLMIFPSWWVYKAFSATGNLPVFLPILLTGLVFHLVLIIVVIRRIFGKILIYI